jgi:hypothetical protein
MPQSGHLNAASVGLMPNTATRTSLDWQKDASRQGTVEFDIFDIGSSFVLAGRQLQLEAFCHDPFDYATGGPPR